jgi:hypothetical protein
MTEKLELQPMTQTAIRRFALCAPVEEKAP